MLSTVTDKGQVTLPKAIRDRLGIGPGTRIDFEVQADDTLKVRVLTRGASGMFGLVARKGERARDLDEIERGITDAVNERSKKR